MLFKRIVAVAAAALFAVGTNAKSVSPKVVLPKDLTQFDQGMARVGGFVEILEDICYTVQPLVDGFLNQPAVREATCGLFFPVSTKPSANAECIKAIEAVDAVINALAGLGAAEDRNLALAQISIDINKILEFIIKILTAEGKYIHEPLMFMVKYHFGKELEESVTRACERNLLFKNNTAKQAALEDLVSKVWEGILTIDSLLQLAKKDILEGEEVAKVAKLIIDNVKAVVADFKDLLHKKDDRLLLQFNLCAIVEEVEKLLTKENMQAIFTLGKMLLGDKWPAFLTPENEVLIEDILTEGLQLVQDISCNHGRRLDIISTLQKILEKIETVVHKLVVVDEKLTKAHAVLSPENRQRLEEIASDLANLIYYKNADKRATAQDLVKSLFAALGEALDVLPESEVLLLDLINSVSQIPVLEKDFSAIKTDLKILFSK